MGLALRQCIELGYHRRENSLGSDLLQVELRKRAFWCVQGMDCISALRLGRPLGIQIHEIDTEVGVSRLHGLASDLYSYQASIGC